MLVSLIKTVPASVPSLVHSSLPLFGPVPPDVAKKSVPFTLLKLLSWLLKPTDWNRYEILAEGNHIKLTFNGLVTIDQTDDSSPLSKGNWVRNARSGGGNSRSNTFASVLAVAWDAGPVSLGGSVYRGQAGQGEPGVEAAVTLAELHGRIAWRGLAAKAIYAVGTLSDSDAVAATPGHVIGSRVAGGYGELAYDLLALAAPGGEAQLSPFVRYEAYDLNDEVASGQARDPAVDMTIWTAGLTWKPLATVSLKADWQRKESRVPGSAADQLNLGMGFVF